MISNVTLRDTGSYSCVARNFAGMKRRSRPARLTVNGESMTSVDAILQLRCDVR